MTAAELLSVAAFLEGKHAQAFPSFGSERMGAPVAAFCRIDERAIRLREPVMEPDAIVVQDPTLLHSVEVFQGLTAEGFVLLNTKKPLEQLGLEAFVERLPPGHALAVPATDIGLRVTGRPLPNVALLGGFAALTRVVSLGAIEEALRGRFQGKIREANILATREAFARVEELLSC